MPPSFIHLRNHSEFSLIDGLLRVKPWMEHLKTLDMPAVALTDENNLFATVKYYKAALAAGIKPIFGADLWLENQAARQQPFRVTLLCQNDLGYKNLRLLISAASHSSTPGTRTTLTYAELARYSEGLLALACAQESDVARALLTAKPESIAHTVAFWERHFPQRFYLEIQRVGKAYETAYNPALLTLALEKNLPVVATNDVRFLQRTDFAAHEARVCIHAGEALIDERRPSAGRYTEEQYAKSAAEMVQLFHDIPQALQNTVEIAQRCNVTLALNQTFLPRFPTPDNLTEQAYLTLSAQHGLTQRPLDSVRFSPQAYQERLATELTVINAMGFAGYFLIVADFIQWAKNNAIPVGPGRGSGAGSLVAYVLGITDLDPLAHDLLFERFLNPERISMPDFDIDFCMEGRDRVIDYVAQKYGRDSVAQITTFGTMAARAVVRDVGRVLGHPYGFVDKIAKLIPFEIGITLEKALQAEPLLYERYQQEEEVRQLMTLAQALEGIARNAGKHAGGVVIAPTVLVDFTATYGEPDSGHLITQLDKDDVEAIGLVKFDFLGLRTLTIIQWALRIAEATQDIHTIPMDDAATYALLASCQTYAIFQLESRGMRDLIQRLKPDCFEDVVALVALFRPGPLQSGMVDDFIQRKHGQAVVEYPHPDLLPILKPTYGVIVYQEQVMQIAQVLAGYTLGGADILRRAMGKKKSEEMAQQRAIFLAGALKRGVDAAVAHGVFDLMEKFAAYGFNKSHSAAYALIAYQTAWLKTHYPAALMAAVLSSDMDNTDKIVLMINEVKALKLPLELPDINRSRFYFTLTPEKTILYGLGAIKGVGQAAVECILAARERHGPYRDLFSFCERVDLQKCNRRVLEALIKAGAMDSFSVPRGCLFAAMDQAIPLAEQKKRDQRHQQLDLFSSLLPHDAQAMVPIIQINPWQEQQRLRAEKSVLGWYASGHPVQHYAKELSYLTTSGIAALYREPPPAKVTLAGVITALRILQTKRGDRMAVVTLEDGTAMLELVVFSDLYTQQREVLVMDNLVIIHGDVRWDEKTEQPRVRAQTLHSLEQARIQSARGIQLRLAEAQATLENLQQLERLLVPHIGGTCPVYIHYQQDAGSTRVVMGEKWKVLPRNSLMDELSVLLGEENVAIGY